MRFDDLVNLREMSHKRKVFVDYDKVRGDTNLGGEMNLGSDTNPSTIINSAVENCRQENTPKAG